MFYKKTCQLLTIVRLQLNLKSYINENNDNINNVQDNSTCNIPDQSFQYYHYRIVTAEGPDTTLPLCNLELKEEFFNKENKVS